MLQQELAEPRREGDMSLYPPSDRTMDQIEALQMQIGELERESNKQSSTGAGLEHRCQQETDEVK
eukprot:COSAG02_NODE_1176_length_14061_cov_96.089529_12_plen_65_part_00